MSDKDFVVKNGLVVNNFLTVNATTIYIGNTGSNATVNTTIYTGTSNNTLYVGTDTDIKTRTAANIVSNSQLQSNLVNYVRLDGLQANIAKMHVNSALYLAPATDNAGDTYLYTNYARYTAPGTFSNNITINGNVVFANVNQTSSNPNYMIVVGNATFQNSVTVTGSYLNTSTNSVSFGTAATIYANGNIGVGNTAPDDKISVTGGIAVTGTLKAGGAATLSDTLSVTKAATFSNSVTVANLTSQTNSTVFGTAAAIYANGNIGVGNTAPIDQISVTGNVAISDTIKIGATVINATNYSGTANNATYLGGVAAASYVTSSGIASSLSSYFKKDAATTVTGTSLFNANVEVRGANLVINASASIVANGGVGSNGQALFSNGAGIYWGSVNDIRFVAPGSNTEVMINDQGSISTNPGFRFIKTTNTIAIGTGTVNSSYYSGTSQDSSNLGGVGASSYALKSDTLYVGTTAIQLNRSGGTQTLTGVSIDGTAGNASKLGDVAASSYVTLSSLSATISSSTANSANYIGSLAAASVVSNTYLQDLTSAFARVDGAYSNPAWITSLSGSKVSKVANATYADTAGSATTATSATSATSATTATSANTATTATNLSGGTVSATTGTFSGAVSCASLTASGEVTAYSDARLKTNVTTIDDALALVKKMRGVAYQRVDNDSKGIGVIAQEMQEVLPEVVVDNGNYLSVAYGNIVGVLIEAIKQLENKISELENK